jgi:alanine racemase
MAVVKADGYGHGAVETAAAAIRSGAEYLGVAFLDEAIQLRNAGIEKPILILGYTPPSSVEAAVIHQISITVFTEDVLDKVIVCAQRLGQKAVIHLKVDTGMSRIGVCTVQEALAMASKARSSELVHLEGIFTHFADADNNDSKFTQHQFRHFTDIINKLGQENIHFPIKHCCNSAAAMAYPEMHMDMVRLGISMYGLLPSPAMRTLSYPLCPAMSMKTKISMLKSVAEGACIGYGCSFETDRESKIATIPVGYADGFPRLLSNMGFILVRGRRAPIVGKICMDQTMIDVTEIPEVRSGDEVTLFGRSGSGVLPVDEIAELAQTINYETVCSVGKRVPRIYLSNGLPIRTSNNLV